jgi:small subunit ribosomal protein S1
VSEGIVGEGIDHQLHRLQAESDSPEIRPGGSVNDDETQGGQSVHLEIATKEGLPVSEGPQAENKQPGAGEAEVNASEAQIAESIEAGSMASGTAASEVSDATVADRDVAVNESELAEIEPETMAEAMNLADMRNLMENFDRNYHMPRRGETVEGVVVRIDKDGILVDVGTKSEGIVSAHEVQSMGSEILEEIKVGDTILVFVVQTENQQGHVVLSLRKARAEKGWRTAQKRFDEGQTVEAKVTEFNRGGLIVNLEGVRGFVPISQVMGLRQDRVAEEDLEKRMAEMVGRTIPLKVIEVNRSRNRLILSERAATQEMRVQRKEQLLDELREGEIRHGRVTSICDFGAFVDLGGADGLVHLSELSWSQIGHPSEVVKVGDEVDVQILGVDRDKKKIALSLRRSQPGPWTRVADRYKVGDIVTGKITKLTNFGAFARIEDGVEGLIHVSELADARVPHPRNVVKEGDTLTLRVIRIDAERRRLGLSLKQAQEEHAELTSEVSSDDVSSDTSNVDSDDSTAPAAAEQPEQSPEQTVEAELASASVESAAE